MVRCLHFGLTFRTRCSPFWSLWAVDLGGCLSTSAKPFCPGAVSRFVFADAGPGDLAKAAGEFASWFQILRLVPARLKVFDATAVRVEHALVYSAGSASGTGRAVAAGINCSNLQFRMTSELSGLSFDPGEESPNTTGQRAR